MYVPCVWWLHVLYVAYGFLALDVRLAAGRGISPNARFGELWRASLALSFTSGRMVFVAYGIYHAETAMREDNFERSLRAFRQRMPFKPFIVELASGTQLIIEHPEALALRGQAAVYINPDGEFTLLDNTMVTRVSDIKGNGSKGA